MAESLLNEANELVVWGPSGSGKTMLLAQLVNHNPTTEVRWRVYHADEPTRLVGAQMRRIIDGSNHFPPATRVDEKERLQFLFRHLDTGEQFRVTLEDRPGSAYEDVDEDSRNTIGRADGLVLLFDAMGEPRVLNESLADTLAKIQRVTAISGADGDDGDPRDHRPIAICLSKADALLSTCADVRRARNEVEAHVFVKSWLVQTRQEHLLRRIETHCADFSLFPVSAVGLELNHGVVQPVVFHDEEFRLRIVPGATAVNLLEPFLWVHRRVRSRRKAATAGGPT